MSILLLIMWATGMLVAARWICGKWFNHLALYTYVWTATTFAFLLHQIEYHAVIFEAWFFIFVAWIALYLGSLAVKLGLHLKAADTFPELNLKRLRYAIILLSAAGLISSAQLAGHIVRALGAGNIYVALSEYADQIYKLRFNGEVSGVGYLSFLPYAGCVLAGIYSARIGRITLIAWLPLLAMLVDGVLSMQRAGMVFGAMLWAFSYLHTPKTGRPHVSRRQIVWIVLAALGAFGLVTGQRFGALTFQGETPELAKLGDSVSGAPVLYFYTSGTIPCFSEYLKNPQQDGKGLWGQYIFASVYRFLSKLGFDTYVPYYQTFYNTPTSINVGTYLREIHRDFGPSAIFLYPFSLGVLIAFLHARRGPFSVVFLSFLYVVVGFSFDMNFIGGGGWYFPLPIAFFCVAIARAPGKASPAPPSTSFLDELDSDHPAQQLQPS